MRKNHPLAKGPLTLSRFLNARHLDVIFPGMRVPLYDSLLESYAHKRNLLLALNSYNPALAIIAQSDYIGVLPTSLLDIGYYGNLVISRQPPINIPVRPFSVIWHQRWDRHAAHCWLREAIIAISNIGQKSAAPAKPKAKRYRHGI